MRRFLIAVLCVLLTAPTLFAVENSNTYMPLVASATFTNRVQYILATEAPVVLAETQTGGGSYTAACHTLRAKLAAQIALGPSGYAPVFAVFLTTNINVTTGGALTGSGATLDTPATDASLLAAVSVLWSSVAGCITTP